MNAMFFYHSSLGKVSIIENGLAITEICFSDAAADAVLKETALLKKAVDQLTEYLDGKRRVFNLPLSLNGTPFQLKVWEALQNIPYGCTKSYGQVAQAIGNKKAGRAVGMANNKNPIAIVVPCHRVIGFDGKLVGYGGGLDKKAYLLELEKRYSGDAG